MSEARTDSPTDAVERAYKEGYEIGYSDGVNDCSCDPGAAWQTSNSRAALPPSGEVETLIERVTLLYKFGGASEATKGWNAAIDAALNALRNSSDGETK